MRYVNELNLQNAAEILQETFSCAAECFFNIWLRKVFDVSACFNDSKFLSLLYNSRVHCQMLKIFSMKSRFLQNILFREFARFFK